MKFKDIVKYFNIYDKCRVHIIEKGTVVTTWNGYIEKIPWVYMDYYLYEKGDGEPITVECEAIDSSWCKFDDPFFDISICKGEN